MSSLPPIPGLNSALDFLPDKFSQLHPHQIRAVTEILNHYDNGIKVVVLDAPTGTGKTVIAEVVRLMLGVRGVYVAHNKDLQLQFANDFGYSKILWGRANYTPTDPPRGLQDISCADCNFRSPSHPQGARDCDFCSDREDCPYVVARAEAIKSPIPVLNSAYWLTSTLNPTSPFARALTVIDECVVEGTSVATPWGDRAVESLRAGDIIWGEKDGEVRGTYVTRTYQRDTVDLIHSVNGVEMTGNHPVFTDRGYVPAALVTDQDTVREFNGKTLRRVRAVVRHEETNIPVLWNQLLLKKQAPHQSQNESGQPCSSSGTSPSAQGWEVRCLAPGPAQPHPRSRGSDPRRAEKGWALRRDPERRQWNRAPEALGSRSRGLDPRIRRQQTSLSQDRYSKSVADGRNRSGWPVASIGEGESNRSAQDVAPGIQGLEDPSVLEYGSTERVRPGSGGDPRRVHNLETGTGNFFAGNLLVHNCDTLEGVLMGQVSINIPERLSSELEIDPPALMTKEDSYAEWAEHTVARLAPAVEALANLDSPSVRDRRRLERLESLLSNVRGMADGLGSGRQQWVYTGGAGSDRRLGEGVEFRPVTVDSFGARVWGKVERALLMSGTVISAGLLLEGLGWQDGDYAVVQVPSQFPPKNRQVVVRGVADMTRGVYEVDRLVGAVAKVLKDHPDDRVLCHTVSYKLAEALHDALSHLRPSFLYLAAKDRAKALEGYRRAPGAVLYAASMDRGVDLPGDDCRVQIVAKVPYPNLGDRQVSARMHAEGGKVWYAAETARTIVQMCGRAVRHQEDSAVVYVLDSSFLRWYRQWELLVPGWFRQAIRFEKGE